ncbi:MAG: DUF2750 domain-containing protein [Planctomycetota bacterium]
MLHDQASLAANHERFVRRIIQNERVWGLDQGNGFAWCESNESTETPVVLFWSDEAYAKRGLENGFDECVVRSIALIDFTFRWLPGMKADDARAGCNWTQDLAGIESNAGELQDEIITAMPAEMADQYLAELRRQMAAQKREGD